ncbi:MAG: tetratricopeptide repeat protein [bacterium]
MRLLAQLSALVIVVLIAASTAAQPANDNLYKARQIFERLIKITPDDPDIYKYLGDIYSSIGDQRKAKDFFEKYSAMRPQDYHSYYKLGEFSWASDDKKKARTYFEKALKLLDPEKGDLQAQMARARMIALTGDSSGSDELFAGLMENNPENPDVANIYIETLIDTDRLDQARGLAEKSASQYPEDYATQRTRVRTMVLNGEYGKASGALSSLMQKYPGDPGLKADYADTLYREGDWYRAKPLFEELAQGNPENPDYKNVLDDIFKEYRPRLMGFMDATFNGADRRYGPYLDYLHPINSQWAFEAGYTFYWNSTNVAGYNPDYWTPTNSVRLLAHYKPYRTLDLGAGLANEMLGTSYRPAPIFTADWNDPRVGEFKLNFIYNDLFDDPVAGLYFDGKQDTVEITYDRLFFDRIIFSTGYSSVWYRVNGSKAGLGLGDDFGRNDVTDTSIQFILIRRPQIRLGYEFYYSKLHVVNNYLNIIPLLPESEQHNILYGITYEWNKWITTDFGGFIGNDSKRDLSISHLDLYGFNIANRVKVSKQLELNAHYEYSSANAFNTLGRYQFFGIDFLYRF